MAANITRKDSPALPLEDRFLIDLTSPSGLRWRTKGQTYKPGDVAGSKNAKGYWKVGKAPNMYWAHRIVYELTYGPISIDAQVDHRDCNPSNNRAANLRACTHGENSLNKFGSASDWYPKGVNINAHTGLVQGVLTKDVKQIRPGKGFYEHRDPSSEAFNTLVTIMRETIKLLHGPFANTQSYYCQLPDEAVFGVDEGYPENDENLGGSISMVSML